MILVWIMRVLSFGGIYWVSWLQSSLQSSHMRQQNFFEVVQNRRLWDWNMIGICNFVDLSCLSIIIIIIIIISTLQVVWWGSKFLLAGASLHDSHVVYFESSWDCCGCCQKYLVIIQRRICGHFAFWNALWVLMFSKCSYPPKYTTNRLRFLCTVKRMFSPLPMFGVYLALIIGLQFQRAGQRSLRIEQFKLIPSW